MNSLKEDGQHFTADKIQDSFLLALLVEKRRTTANTRHYKNSQHYGDEGVLTVTSRGSNQEHFCPTDPHLLFQGKGKPKFFWL